MATLLIIFAILAFFHFFIENVGIPTLQSELKEDLYDLLKTVEEMKFKFTSDIQKSVLNNIESSIQLTLHRVSSHSLLEILIFIFSRTKRERDIADLKIKKKLHDLKTCGIPNIEKIYSKYLRYVGKMFLVNSGAMIFYFSPFIIVAIYIDAIKIKIHSKNSKGRELNLKMYEKRLMEYKQFEKRHKSQTSSYSNSRFEVVA